MLFVELRFFVFFALVFGIYWSLRGNKSRKVFLTLSSYVFYGAWDWRFLGLILFSTCLDYLAGKGIYENTRQGIRKAWLMASLVGNLGLLGVYKYFDFFSTTAADLLQWFGFEANLPLLNVILPVGISFYTFQTLSYSIDIYRRKLAPVEHFLDLALFVGFFPQLVAGPVVRAIDFLPQLETKRSFKEHVAVRPALMLFFAGYVKKACLSDNVASVAQSVFEAPETLDWSSSWLGALCAQLQFYCDFSGYTDMALGTALLLGFKLPLNFNFPYLARSASELWRRWHISLATWFFNYLYIPLGGSKKGAFRMHLNLLLVFLISGLWHGAAWTYVVWGLLNGIVVVVERMGLEKRVMRLPAPLAVLYANLIFISTLQIFRAPDLGSGVALIKRLFLPFSSPQGLGGEQPFGWGPWVVVVLFTVSHILNYHFRIADRLTKLPPNVFGVLYGAAWAVALPFVATGHTPFIYFQF